MGTRPKPLFWIALLAVVVGLVAYAIHRARVRNEGGSADAGSRAAGSPAPRASAPPSGPALELAFHTSSAKKAWANEMVERFNAAGHRVNGLLVRVKATHVESGASLDQLEAGKARPDVWSPGDESWIRLANAHWKRTRNKELFARSDPLVNIPLVVAMWEPMARALGYPKPIGWLDIAKLAANPQGWAAYGHPEWGRFRWGHAHPDANSGFLAVISEVYAALGKTSGISPDDLRNPAVRAALQQFEGAVEHYGLSNSWIDDMMHSRGPAYLSCAVQYENTIAESNEKHQNQPFKLVAVYPREGNFWTQHPAAIPDEEWMTPDRRAAARAFVDFLLSREAQEAALRRGLRPILADIEIGAPLDEAHGILAKPPMARQFQVPDEAVLKRIRDLWEDAKVPATVILVLDRSSSMKGPAMDGARAGAIEFVRQMRPRDRVEAVVFSSDIATLSGPCSIRECGEQTIDRLSGVFAEGQTSLYDVIALSFERLRKMQEAEPRRRYAAVVLSDGQDTSSKQNRHDFLDRLPRGEEVDVPKIFTIAYGSQADTALLSEVSNRTNARIFSSTAEEIGRTYKELSANF
ncbi:MAG TPA: VWA domain-containing protein [Anaeromyxobacter sp.]|nr:VWA domain-containing protein [Anaeromyxobacter sp.]